MKMTPEEKLILEGIKSNFPVGRTVVLNSGGPAMVIEMHRSDGLICTHWFNGDVLVRDCFDPLCLLIVPLQHAL